MKHFIFQILSTERGCIQILKMTEPNYSHNQCLSYVDIINILTQFIPSKISAIVVTISLLDINK